MKKTTVSAVNLEKTSECSGHIVHFDDVKGFKQPSTQCAVFLCRSGFAGRKNKMFAKRLDNLVNFPSFSV